MFFYNEKIYIYTYLQVVAGLLESERVFVDQLLSLISTYIVPLQTNEM